LFGVDNGFADTDSFLERGLIDSTGVLELVAFLQDRFGFEVEDGELLPENLDSIERVCSYVSQKLAVSHH
jgi:acyl carrier protein